jgi:betaine lipid synthase
MDWLHVYIAGAAFLVFALVALVLLISSQQLKVDLNQGVFTYLKFIYASFIKPHDRGAEDQQDALESFYKTQVREGGRERGSHC